MDVNNSSYPTTSSTIVVNSLTISLYYVTIPCFILFGLIGNIFSFYSFWKKRNSDLFFWYHMLIIANGTFCLIGCIFLYTTLYWLNLLTSFAPLILRQNSFVMNFVAHCVNPLCNIFITGAPLLNFSMCLDRLYAMFKPLQYRTVDKKRYVIVSALLILFLSLLTSLFDFFRYDLSVSDDNITYVIINPSQFMSTGFGKSLVTLRSLLRVTVIFLVIASNLLVAWKFRKHNQMKKIAFSSSETDKVKIKQMLNESVLNCMLLVQGTLLFIGHAPMAINNILSFLFPSLDSEPWRKNYNHFANVALAFEVALTCSAYFFTTKQGKTLIMLLTNCKWHKVHSIPTVLLETNKNGETVDMNKIT